MNSHIFALVLCYLYIIPNNVYTLVRNGTGSQLSSHESRLRAHLLARSESVGILTRPVLNASLPIKVYYGMRLIEFDVDEATQTLITNVWIRMKWYDEFLKWDARDYGGIERVTFPAELIWTPRDVTVANTVDTHRLQQNVDVRVRNDGMMFWSPQRRYNSECFLDLTYYPYDRHICSIWIQSLAGYGTQIDLQLYNNAQSTSSNWDLETYMESHANTKEWLIRSNDSDRVTSSRAQGVVLMYSRKVALRFSLGVERRAGFIAYMLMFPSVVLSFLATLIFCLPPERPDRNMLAMSLFASFMFFLLILADNVPPSAAATPKLVWMYCFNLAVTVGCIVSSVIIINISKRGELNKPVPKCVQKVFFIVVAKVLLMGDILPPSPSSRPKEPSLMKTDPRQNNTCVDILPKGSTCKHEKTEEKTVKVNIIKQWRTLGFILDRCLFIFFILINIIAILILFPRQ